MAKFKNVSIAKSRTHYAEKLMLPPRDIVFPFAYYHLHRMEAQLASETHQAKY
ncbi:15544_t:CDS:1, partial [Racocetra fulgida]